MERYVGNGLSVGLTNPRWHIARDWHLLACYVAIVIDIMVIMVSI